jgi:ubiquitin C-terminal hydrolase
LPEKRVLNLAGDLIPEEVDNFQAMDAGKLPEKLLSLRKRPRFEIEEAAEVRDLRLMLENTSSVQGVFLGFWVKRVTCRACDSVSVQLDDTK